VGDKEFISYKRLEKKEKTNTNHTDTMTDYFELTPTSLKKLCRDLKLYSSCPELNEVIHLHQKGILKIQNLHEYTGLRTLYLECNVMGVSYKHSNFQD